MQNLMLMLLVAAVCLYGMNSIVASLMRLLFALTRNLIMLLIVILCVLTFLGNHLVYIP